VRHVAVPAVTAHPLSDADLDDREEVKLADDRPP
jgi:hypothetical protein